MDKNTITGFVLIAAVLFGYSFWSQKNAEEAEANQPAVEQTAQAKTDKTQDKATKAAEANTAANVDSTAVFYNHLASKAEKTQPVVLKNDKVEVTINPAGGLVSSVNLREYKSYDEYHNGGTKALPLYTEKDAKASFTFETKEENILTSDYVFTAENVTDSTVTMALHGQHGELLAFDYKLTGDYMVNLDVRTQGMSKAFSPKTKTFSIDWQDQVAQHEKGYYFENMYSTLTYKLTDGDTEKLKEQGNETEDAEGTVRWVAFKNQYFSSCMIAADGFNNAEFESEQCEEGSGYLKSYKANLEASFDPTGKTATRLQYYFGPNNFRLLQSMDDYSVTGKDLELEDLVYLGWPLVRWINRFFTLYVFDFLTAVNLPMWLVLLLITLLLRVIVYGPTRKSFLSSAKMRVLRPKVEEINKKYPGDENNMKRQQEMMTLYNQYGASPMGGCLPMLIQMPIWIAMFNFVPNAIELRQQSFLWADDLSAYDSLISWNTEIWGIGDHLSLFCILFCGTNILYSYMSMRQQKDMMAGNPEQAQQMKMMQWMMYLMPLMFFFMFNKYSAGLNYYYFISLLFSALTMWFLRRTTDDEKLLAKLEAYREKNKNNPAKKAGGLAARLQALQEEPQKLLDEQRAKNAAMRNN
ncbi:MAG: membrane protein insertase YidC, partial [Bacteroidales bacterium]|nr:membrane protein insertase YidC [Bacteroidales bacterium]